MFKRFAAAFYKGLFDRKDNLDLLGLAITMVLCVLVFGVPPTWLGKAVVFTGYAFGWGLLKAAWSRLTRKRVKMSCPSCNDKGYVEVGIGAASVNVECDHMVADPNCGNCGGKGYTTAFGMNLECGCKRRYDARPLSV